MRGRRDGAIRKQVQLLDGRFITAYAGGHDAKKITLHMFVNESAYKLEQDVGHDQNETESNHEASKKTTCLLNLTMLNTPLRFAGVDVAAGRS